MKDDLKPAQPSEKSVERPEEIVLRDQDEGFLVTSITYDAEQNVVLETSWTCSSTRREQPDLSQVVLRDFDDEFADDECCPVLDDRSLPDGATAVFEYCTNGDLVYYSRRSGPGPRESQEVGTVLWEKKHAKRHGDTASKTANREEVSD